VNIPREISTDIVKYLQEKKGQSVPDIAKFMSTTPTHIQAIIDQKSNLQLENVDNYLNNLNMKFWEFISEAIPEEHLSPRIRSKIQLCQELAETIKKKKH
jgi:hypothetical protein